VFTGRLAAAGIAISMDGRGRWMDNVFIERVWRSLKYEEVHLKAYADGRSGDGFNVILQALPLPDGDGTCKIVLRPPKDNKGDKDAEDELTRQAVRQTNDRRHGRTR
jgi:transposase InsO family protein